MENGQVITQGITLIHAESFADDVKVTRGDDNFTGTIPVENGVVLLSAQKKDENGKRIKKRDREKGAIYFHGKSLIHSAPLTTEAFKHSFLGDWGQYIVSIGLLLFAFSTAISWSYYGDRAVTYLWGSRFVIYYRIIYVMGFFVASFTDTTIVWNLSYITIAIMTIPNLFGLLVLRRDIRDTIRSYWSDFRSDWPMEKMPIGTNRK